jgi:hypothetical protein
MPSYLNIPSQPRLGPTHQPHRLEGPTQARINYDTPDLVTNKRSWFCELDDRLISTVANPPGLKSSSPDPDPDPIPFRPAPKSNPN